MLTLKNSAPSPKYFGERMLVRFLDYSMS